MTTKKHANKLTMTKKEKQNNYKLQEHILQRLQSRRKEENEEEHGVKKVSKW